MRKIQVVTIFSVFMLFAATASAGDATYSVDYAHSEAGFTVRHLGISKVKGKFNAWKAEVKADAKTGKLTSVEATAQVDSIDTGIEKRDGHLKAPDFFDAAKFPTITFKSTSIKITGDKAVMTGKLTMKGVTKTVTFKGEFLGKQKANFGQGDTLRAGYSFETEINRKDFGLSFNMLAEGVAVVSDTVKIQLEAEIYRAL